MTAYSELFIDQGANFNTTITLTDDVTNVSLNLMNYSVVSQLRRSYYSVNAAANIVCTLTDSRNGQITMAMTSANTSNLKPGRYVFDVYTIDLTSTKSRVLEGIVFVTPGVSK